MGLLIPSLSITQADDCLSVYLKDITKFYDAITNPCGYSPVVSDESPYVAPVNPTRPSITRSAITITTPSGEIIILAKTYLPSQATSLKITCADLIISSVAPVVVSTDSCGCGTISSVTDTPATCFFDGCWTFQYDVYATESLTTYEWDITAFVYLGYCVVLTIDGEPISVGTAISDEETLLTYLNRLDSGYFTITDHILSVTSYAHTYGNLIANDAETFFTVTWEDCSFDFPKTFESITISGVPHTINQSVNNWDEIIAIINNLGLAEFYNGGGDTATQIITQSSCEDITIDAMSFTDFECAITVEKTNPSTSTFTPETESVDQEVLVGTKTQTQFLYCNVKALRKNFKLTQLKAVCDCNAGSVCEMDSDYSTMLIAAEEGGTCSCKCAQNYLKKTQQDLAFLLKQCP